MKVLIVTGWPGAWPYIPEMVEKLKEQGVECDVFDTASCRMIDPNFRGSGLLSHIQRIPFRLPLVGPWLRGKVMRAGLRTIKDNYDAASIHFISPFYVSLIPLLQKKARRIIASVWGSDFLRMPAKDREGQRQIYDSADAITFNNTPIRDAFLDYYGDYAEKCSLIRFGIGSLDVIDRISSSETRDESARKLGLPIGKIIVAAGYNATPAQQHKLMIRALASLTPAEKERICLVLQLTYPDDSAYRKSLQASVENSGLETVVLNRRLVVDDLARLRISTDIVLNFQKTDSLSGTIQEHAYCGARFIVGSWLPYSTLEDIGVVFEKADGEGGLTALIREMIAEPESEHRTADRRADLHKALREFSSWESNITGWLVVFAGRNKVPH